MDVIDNNGLGNLDDLSLQVDNSDETMQILEQFADTLKKCSRAINIEAQVQEFMKPNLCKRIQEGQSMDTPYLFTMEKNLLSLSSYPDCTDGILYAMPIVIDIGDDNKVLYVRCFESGVFHGFFRSKGVNLLKSLYPEAFFIDIVFSFVYTEWDSLAAYSHRTVNDLKRKPKNSIIFNNIVRKYKSSLTNTLPFAYTQVKNIFSPHAPGYIVYCQRSSAHARVKDIKELSYFNLSGLGQSSDWDNSIKTYMMENRKTTETFEILNSIYVNKSALTLQEQYHVLTFLPNYHHWKAKPNHGVKMEEYFVPAGKSPRNEIIKEYLCPDSCDTDENIYNILQIVKSKLYRVDDTKVSLWKRRKTHRKTPKPKLCVSDILDGLGMSENDFEVLQTENEMTVSFFENFKTNLYLHGSLKWRVVTPHQHKVVMNDYNSENGEFKLHDFVIVQKVSFNGVDSWQCTCDTYRVLLSTVQLQYETDEWSGLMCCHCRLLQELVNEISFNTNHSDHYYVYHESLDAPEMIRSALSFVSSAVIELPSKIKHVRKYSVVAENEVEFIHVFKSSVNQQYYVSCQSGLCQHSFGKKRILKRLNEFENICSHLTVFKIWLDSHPIIQQEHSDQDGDNMSGRVSENDEFVRDDDSAADDDGVDDDDDDDDGGVKNINEEDDNIDEFDGELDSSKWKDCFDPVTGMWEFSSPYGRQVNREGFGFAKECVHRQHMSLRYLLNQHTEDNILFPCIASELCSCELPWPTNEDGDVNYTFDCNTTLYTKLAAIPCEVFKLVCSVKKCSLIWNGSKESVFRISSAVCAGEELCWEYIDMVTKIKCNFAAYCSIMSASYLRHDPSSRGFMSSKTFRNLFFSWASYQKIDFRQMCDWCGSTPSVLACDATKIGIAYSNCSIPPIERPANDDVIQTPHRRYDRCFLSSAVNDSNENLTKKEKEVAIRDSRKHAKLIMSTPTGYLQQESLTSIQLTTRNANLLSNFPAPCKPLLQRLFSTQLSTDQMKYTAKMFYILSFDAPLRSFIPQAFQPRLKKLIYDINNKIDTNFNSFYQESLKFNPTLGNFVLAYNTTESSFDRDALAVISYIIETIDVVHSNDVDATPPSPFDASYNPPRLGRAYYFTSSGKQVRSVRQFTIDQKVKGQSKKTHDDLPTNSNCSKKYPVVAMKGSTFLFLWFCPLHGHCYGFHIVNGSEGRKDPCSSLYTHLVDAPDTIYYDFACSLEEYCLNRESGFYKKTRFFHDVFHGYTHSCSSVYSSKRLLEQRSVNSSLCEQFNSYLQCIKSSAKHMSQVRFMFYVQFMIHIWNERKKLSYSRKLKVAASGGR